MQYPKVVKFCSDFVDSFGCCGVERYWLKLEVQKIFWIKCLKILEDFKMKKRAKKLMAMLMAVTILGSGSIVSHASAEDYVFTDFTIRALSYTQVSAPRAKENSSSVYCYITNAGNSVKAQTWGCSANTFNENLTINSDGTSTSSVTLAIGTEYQIYNGIYEEGYKYAGLKLKSKNVVNADTISGRWSADSVNTSNMTVASN